MSCETNLAVGSVSPTAVTSIVALVPDHRVDRQVACPHSHLVVHLFGPGLMEEPVDGDIEAGLTGPGAAGFGPVEGPLGMANVVPMGPPGRDVPVLRAPHPHVHLAPMAPRTRVDPGLDQ